MSPDSTPPPTAQLNATINATPRSPPYFSDSIASKSPMLIAPNFSITPSTPATPKRMPPPVPTSFWNDQPSSRSIGSPPRLPSPPKIPSLPGNNTAEAEERSSPARYRKPYRSPPTSKSSVPILPAPQLASPPIQQQQPHQPRYADPGRPANPQTHLRHSSLSPHVALTYTRRDEQHHSSGHLRKSSSSAAINFSRPQPSSPPPPLGRPLSDRSTRPRAISMTPQIVPDIDMAPRRISPDNSRPSSLQPSFGDSERRSRSKRRSWGLGGLLSSRNASEERSGTPGSNAWLEAAGFRTNYDMSPLLSGDKVPEIWDDGGTIFVYLFPKEANSGPSFRISSELLSSSSKLVSLIHGSVYSGRSRAKSFDGRTTLTAHDAMRNLAARGIMSPPITPQISPQGSDSDGHAESIGSLSDAPKEVHLYFPVELNERVTPGCNEFSPDDVQNLIDARNLFAFLLATPLVATPKCPTIFNMLLSISSLLRRFEFTNFDGSTYGETPSASFCSYVEEFELANVSHSREKIIEALVLGERMRSADLYHQAFVHAVGRCEEITTMQSPIFSEISQSTRNRLQRAHLDLLGRQKGTEARLMDFYFPSLWVGIAASTSISEVRSVRFKSWKSSFSSMRRYVMSYYKDLYGSWPPKPNGKRNSFSLGGLSRLVLQQVYSDFCNLYDLLADRKSITTRQYDDSSDELDIKSVNRDAAALRKILSEWDRSEPPVQPPIPFDIPMVPTLATIMTDYSVISPEDQRKLRARRLRAEEFHEVMRVAQNTADCDFSNPFIANFKYFEEKEAKGKTMQDIIDNRYGHWIFLYVVLQSLPLLVVDAPGVKYTDGVEYFLCEPPIGNVPWLENSNAITKSWYGIQGGKAVVSLPSDVVQNSVEGIFHRSHCWTIADKWITAQEGPSDSYIPTEPAELPSPHTSVPNSEPFGLPGPAPNPASGTNTDTLSGHSRRSSAPSMPLSLQDESLRIRSRKRQSIVLGLEQLPIPATIPGNDLPSTLAAVDEVVDSAAEGDTPGSSSPPFEAARSRGTSPIPLTSRNRYRRQDRRVSGQYAETSNGSRVGSGTFDVPIPPVPQNEGATFDSILGEDEDTRRRSRSKNRRKSWFPDVLSGN